MDNFYNKIKEIFDSLPTKANKYIIISENPISTQDYSYSPSLFAEVLVNPIDLLLFMLEVL